MNQNLINRTLQAAAIVLSLLHLIIFLGVFLFGIQTLLKAILTPDIIWGLMIAIIGLVMGGISGQYLIKFFNLGEMAKFWYKIKNRKVQYLVVAIVFVGLYFIRFETPSLLLYLGNEVGRFFTERASTAYFKLTGLDLDKINLTELAWIFQWYFIAMIVEWLFRIGRKFKPKPKSS